MILHFIFRSCLIAKVKMFLHFRAKFFSSHKKQNMIQFQHAEGNADTMDF